MEHMLDRIQHSHYNGRGVTEGRAVDPFSLEEGQPRPKGHYGVLNNQFLLE